jgi:hypothetical protein
MPGDVDDADLDTRRLIGHEVAHALQQRRGTSLREAAGAADLRQLESEAERAGQAFALGRRFDVVGRAPSHSRLFDGKPEAVQGVGIPFSVAIDRMMDNDQLLLEFVKQYRGVATDEEAERLRNRENWQWTDKPPTVTERNVRNGFILVTVVDTSIKPSTSTEKVQRAKYFKTLSPDEQASINAEADQEFWTRTRYGVGRKLGTSTTDRRMAETWKTLRNELIRKRQALDLLPADIRAFVLDDESPKVEPKDFDAVLRIASKVAALSTAELAEYKSRVTAITADWDAYEASIDRFIAERKQREKDTEERRTIETRLFGLESLYQRHRQLKSILITSAVGAALGANSPHALGASLGAQPTIEKMRTELDADLRTAGFAGGIADFEKLIKQYEVAFERETRAVADVMLDQYAHTLFVQERRYQKPAEVAALNKAVSTSQAGADYAEAESLSNAIAATSASPDGILLPPDKEMEGKRLAATGRAESKMAGIGAAHPLVANQDFKREALARATSENEVQSQMLGYIAARKKDIEETRAQLKAHPTMVYGLDALLKASFAAQGIEPGSIFEGIIRDHIADVHLIEAIPQIVLAVVAIAAGILSGGTGTVAVLAAGTSLGIGAYQAIEEFRRYERQSAAYGAQLTSDDPTLAWVIVAVIGAGFDVALFASALPKLRPALQAFNQGPEAGNLLSLEERLAKIADVEEGIKRSILRAAQAEADARAAWKAIVHPPAVLRAVVVPLAEEFGRLVYAVYLSFRRGIREFQVFVKTNEAIELIGDVAKLGPEELALVKTGYLEAIKEMEVVAAHGQALGMSENEIRAFMNLRSETKSMRVADITARMDAWKTTKASGVPFAFESAEQFNDFRALVASELKKALKSVHPKAEAYLQGSALSGVSYKRHLPFDAKSDLDIAITSRPLFRKAEKLGYGVSLSPRRIGPLDPDQIQQLGLGKLQRRIEEATGSSRDANFMLFENADAMRKPIGSNSAETERAATLLQGD